MIPSRLLQHLLILAIGLPLSAQAELDVVQARMLAPYSLPLRWDNFEQCPEWLRGEKPALRKDLGIHVVRLAPGAWIEVRVTGGEILRVSSLQQALTPENLRIWVSNGTGLYAEPKLQKTADSMNWLARADFTSPAIYRLQNTNTTTDPIEIALFASRRERLGELAPYRQLLPLPGQEVALRRSFEAAPQRYWKIESEQAIALKVTGPRRLTLESRMRYPLSESKLLQSWRVNAWLDDQPLHTAEMESNAETLQEILVDQANAITSRVERLYLEIPEGEHQLRLQSSAPLYARLLQQDSTDYLLPELNQPLQPAESARDGLDPKKAAQTSWLRTPDELQAAARTSAESADIEQAAQRLAMDNRWRDGGVAGAAMLDQAAQARPEDRALETRAGTFAGAHTFFRDLLPKDKEGRVDMTYRWFRLPRLPEPGKDDRNLVVAPQHAQDLLERLGSGYFVALPARSATPTPIQTTKQASQTTESVRELILFEPYSDRITPEAQSRLQALATRWRATGDSLLEIRGYTASNVDSKYNQKLSERRATAVAQALAKLGLKATIVKAEGRGITDPAADNTTSAGRQQNRRVEITFQRQVANHKPTAPAPRRPDSALYRLPEALAPRTLRIAAYGDRDAEFFIQIDQQPSRRLRFSLPDRLPLEDFSPALGDGGLLLQHLESDPRNDGTQSASFARTHVAAPMVTAGVVELTLPANCRDIRLWRADEGDTGLHVAVQYQASAAFQLSEREFLALHDLDQDSGLPLRQALHRRWQDTDSPGGDLLATQWRPLARLLASEYRQAKAGVRAQPTPAPTTIDSNAASKQARAAEVQYQWLVALEQWSRIWFSSSPRALREEAEWGRINALHHLGEDFMFEQMLKQILFFDPDTQRCIRALNQLEQHYRSTDDNEALLRLYAIAVQQFDDLTYWHKLTQSLLDNGEFRLALLAGLALPPDQRPTELLLRASWRLNWWQTFDRLQAGLTAPEQQSFWLGMRAAAHGQFDTANSHFQAAGVDSRAYGSHITDGLALQAALATEHPTSADTFIRWSRWQTEAPGPRTWRDTPESVKDFVGALPGYAIDRDLHFSLYKASAERPLQLRVTGPARLRLEIRPIHASVDAPTLEGWITARSDQGLWTAPIIANQPTEGLQLADGTLVGRKILLEIPASPGQQTINVSAGALPIAVRVHVEQPMLPLGVLPTPPLAESGDPLAEQLNFEKVLQPDTWYRHCEGCLTVPEVDQRTPPAHYRMAAVAPHAALVPLLSHDAPMNIVDREAQLLSAGEYDRLLDSFPLTHDQPKKVLQRMTWLLWTAETSPRHFERTLAAGQALAAANPGVDGLSRLLDRLSRSSGWNAQETVQESAGVRLLPVSGWQPESPSSRTQKALLPPLAENEQVISGNARMVLSLLNNKPGKVDFDLMAEDLGGLPPQPLQVIVQRDEAKPETITLIPGAGWQPKSLNLPTGRHALRFSIQNPVANQLLRIRLRERRGQPVTNQFERMYQIATASQPLRAILPGPVWLRIDEWRDGQTQSRYHHLAEPWQTITLTPEPGRKEALFRLHLRTPAPAQPLVSPRQMVTESVPIPHPPVRIDDPAIADTIRLVDEFKLGDQEDGTWTLAIEGHSRYDADSKGKEKYLESSLTHRYFDEPRQTYFTSRGLVRLRQDGNPTLGVKLRADHHPWGIPLNIFAEASAYAQTVPLIGNHWSTSLKAGISQHREIDPKTWHTPWLTAFAYKLGSDDANNPEKIDQDIATHYKSQHRFGYEIGDRLTYRPWLDTLLNASIGITSNENLVTPDKMRMAAEWKQLLGDWQMDAHAALTHYFSDSDRNKAVTRREMGLSLRWENWQSNQDRVEVLFDLTHNFDAGGIWGWIGLRWHFDHGRGYRDFRTGEVDFRDLRERNLPDQSNNRIEPDVP